MISNVFQYLEEIRTVSVYILHHSEFLNIFVTYFYSLSVFTHGHWINNRSLFASQDSPVAMATWEASIHVPNNYIVLMSGDQNASCFYECDGKCNNFDRSDTFLCHSRGTKGDNS